MRCRTGRGRYVLLAAGAAALTAAGGALAGPASAATATPAPFSHCPVDWVGPAGDALTTCLASVGLSGTFTLGNTTVTLPAGTTLQGGLGVVDGDLAFVPATDGATLTTPDVSVPGGLLNSDELEHLLPGITDITARVRLVGTPEFSLGANIDITLPIEVDLVNNLLGPDCRIGSPQTPIVLHLTTGTTSPPAGVAPISGAVGTISTPPIGDGVVEFGHQVLVDNSFAVPGASGCGALGLLDGAVDGKTQLPSPAGTNLASLTTDTYIVSAGDVGGVSGYPGS